MKLMLVDGYPYVVIDLEDERGWLTWKLKLGSEAHHVWPGGCTCKAEKPCKHMVALNPPPKPPPARLEPKDRRRSRG